MTMRLRFGLMALMALIMRVTAFQAKIACDDELTVYLDGTEVATDLDWWKVNDISLAYTPTVIAAKCVNTGGAGGIVGSFDDGVVTDTTWRCSDTEAAGWEEASFDDTAWAPAVESTTALALSDYGGVSPSAKFIWSDTQSTGTTYCRKNLRPDTTFRGKIACDNELTVYLDGTEVASDTEWEVLNDISFPDKPAVIAAKCLNTGGPAGIVGSFDGGLVTDATWRCSAVESDGWADASFDDSVWSSAVESTNAPPLSSFEGVPPSAKFIWTSSMDDDTVYCRLNLAADSDKGEVIPEGCKYRGVVHPAGETWLQEVNAKPLRQRQCTCPDPLPETWHAKTGGCTAVCVMSDGVVHYGGDEYQRTVDGTTLDCKCNSFGRERCRRSAN